MPAHDWTRVNVGLFHDFHGAWIQEIKGTLNAGVLPADYYAVSEADAFGLKPDVLALHAENADEDAGPRTAVLTAPRLRPTAETGPLDGEVIAIRSRPGDELVAVIEVVSPANKTRHGLNSFLAKLRELLLRGVHLLVLDLIRPTNRDPDGLHVALWDLLSGSEDQPPQTTPFALLAYEVGPRVRAYTVPVAVGDSLPDMPLFLLPGQCVEVPLEATYTAALARSPAFVRRQLEAEPA